ncbi:hypothetical protein [Thalassococcus sp. S3]|uniref:hypothetical protein n=1 Tax=Thalassococcus sp. S3 TaxID=2017482 RepID=UPI0010246433|nr:hypothetical protein [Thalassococcus sp. S3]QBF30798.1 hypothetical protein CFI11_06145 [Thalassococcus sp. S3]
MTKVFFTYVWGPPGDPAWPMTFASKAARSHAKRFLTEGDLVFTVGTKSEPTPVEHQGKVLGVFRVSDLEVSTIDYDLPRRHDNPEYDGVIRHPYALHPIEAWEITATHSKFSELVGPLTGKHHLQAQSKVVELDEITAAPLVELDKRQVTPALPKTEFGLGRVAKKNSKLAPKHQGSHSVTFGAHDLWYVYALVLRDAKKKVLAVKVGYSHDPEERKAAHNCPMAWEVTGLSWNVDFAQPTANEDTARDIEQAMLTKYAEHKLDSNGEILAKVDPMLVAADIANLLRTRSAPN